MSFCTSGELPGAAAAVGQGPWGARVPTSNTFPRVLISVAFYSLTFCEEACWLTATTAEKRAFAPWVPYLPCALAGGGFAVPCANEENKT